MPYLPGEIQLRRVKPRDKPPPDFIPLPTIEAPELRAARRPDWLRVRFPCGERYQRTLAAVEAYRLHTVCQSAYCLNMGECWGAGTATFLILGDVCTRSCGFCAVRTGRPDSVLDRDESRRVAEAVHLMNLGHAVVTSVTRDDLDDGGARLFAETIRQIRLHQPGCTVEVLIPDFRADADALGVVFDARPDLLDHNVETVPRLYRRVRPQATYARSLEVLRRAKDAGLRTKTSLMVGLGETETEVLQVMDDLVEAGVDVLTIGQYLQPTRHHLPIDAYVPPDQFVRYREAGEARGLGHVESGPLVRTSYHAERHVGGREDGG